jgi:hypothetical protein
LIWGFEIPEPATYAITAPWEDPVDRFRRGRGEATLGEGGRAFTIWEALVHFADNEFPIQVNTTLFSRADLISQAYTNLLSGLASEARMALNSSTNFNALLELLGANGCDLSLLPELDA